jgi:putative membrane protein
MSSKRLLTLYFSVSLITFSIFLTFSSALAQRGDPWSRHAPGMICGGGGIFFLLMLIFLVLVIVGLILLIRLLLQKTSTKTKPIDTSTNALAILNERYVKGEIEREEFEEKKQDLTS